MKRLLWGNRKDADFTAQESELQEVFHPVAPRAEFVRNLRNRVRTDFPVIRDEIQENKRMTVLILGASLASAGLAFVMGARMIITLGGVIGLLFQLKKPSQPETFVGSRRLR